MALGPGVLLALTGCSPFSDEAVWELMRSESIEPTTQTLEIGVSRLECSSGETGEVFAPSVRYEDARIVIGASVAPLEGDAHDCRGNEVVPVTVELDQPIGDRELVDGACLDGGAGVGTSFCSDDGVRWGP